MSEFHRYEVINPHAFQALRTAIQDPNLAVQEREKLIDNIVQYLSQGYSSEFHRHEVINPLEFQALRTAIQDPNLPAQERERLIDSIVQYLLQGYSIARLIGNNTLVSELKAYLETHRPDLVKQEGDTLLTNANIQQAIEDVARAETIAELEQITFRELMTNAETRDWVRQQLQELLPHIDFSQPLSKRGYQKRFDEAINESEIYDE